MRKVLNYSVARFGSDAQHWPVSGLELWDAVITAEFRKLYLCEPFRASHRSAIVMRKWNNFAANRLFFYPELFRLFGL